MAKDRDHYYAAEVEEHFRSRTGPGIYTTGALVIAGLVGLGLGWLIYDQVSTKAEENRRQRAREINKANARRALEMKRRQARPDVPETQTPREGMRNIPRG